MARLGSCLRGVLFPALVCLLTFDPKAFTLDPHKKISQYVHDIWQSDQGLPQNSVQAMVQTRDGYLWLATQEGLVRFDGVRFTIFDTQSTGAIKNNIIDALFEDRDANLWIGTMGGLTRFKDGEFTAYTVSNGLSDNDVVSMTQDADGNLWFGTRSGGLNLSRNGKFTAYTTAQGLPNNTVRALYPRHDGSLWIGTDGGLARFQDGKIARYTAQGEPGNRNVLSLWENKNGVLWIGSSQGLYCFAKNRFTAVREVPRTRVNAVYEDQEGSLWVGTDKSLYRVRGHNVESYLPAQGLSEQEVAAIYEDREGSLFVGTHGGLDRLRDGKFAPYGTPEGLPNNFVDTILEAANGDLWIGGAGGLARFRHGHFATWTEKDGLRSDYVASIWEDRVGNIWAGTARGISRLHGGRITSFTTRDGLSGGVARGIYEDRQGSIWIGTDHGLNRFQKGKFTRYTTKDGLSNEYVRSIFEDHQGDLWIGTVSGLNLRRNGKFLSFPAKEALSHDFITTIREDPNGTLWIGTQTSGIKRLRNGEVTSYRMNDGLFQNTVWTILFDGKGDAWLSSNKGIFRVSRKELDDFAEKKINTIHSTVYGTADGMRSSECNGGQPAGVRTRDGRLWFPTTRGLAALDPAHIPSNTLPPPVLIEEVRVNDQPMQRLDFNRLPAESKRFEFHYAGLSLRVPERMRFRYKLVGFDRDWVDAGNRRTAYYTNLPAGDYSFKVIASNDDGVWNETGASVAFQIEPRFYQTYWFYGLCILSVVFSGTGIFRLRTRQLRERALELARTVDERTKDLQAEVIERKRVQEQLREHKDHLEEEVAERTAQLEESNARLRQAQKMEAVGRLAGGIAHDFNNLLTVIRGYSNMVLNREQDQQLRNQIERIDEAAGRAAALTSQLLAFSRQQVLEPKVFNLNSLLLNLDKMLQRLIGEDIEMVSLPAPDLGSVKADPNQIEQVIMNLAVNARDAMPKGGKLTLETANVNLDQNYARQHTSVHPGPYVMLAVSDTGVGMDPETQASIFEPFFTTKGLGKGTGLGLSTVYGIVKQSGGNIWVYSEPGRGSTFKVYFPRIDAPAETIVLPQQTTGSVEGHETILLVEDDRAVRELARTVLADCGYSVLAAESASRVSSLSEHYAGPIHLLLTDVVMPGLNGRELARRVIARRPGIKVLYMSGYSTNAIVHHGALDPNTFFVPKPFTPDSLTRKVREVLDSAPGKR